MRKRILAFFSTALLLPIKCQRFNVSFIFSDNAVGPRYEDTPDIQAGSPLCRAAKFALHSETSKEYCIRLQYAHYFMNT